MNPDKQGREESVREFYEGTPYPGIDARLKDQRVYFEPVPHLLELKELRYLDAGCGTGHGIVGMATRVPNWNYHGMDLSEPSLAIAKQLAQKHDASVKFAQGSYLAELPFAGPFDVIMATGTIHHTPDPAGAIHNLLRYLADDGVMFIWLYGKEADRRRLLTVELLDTLVPDKRNYGRRLQLYQDLLRKKRLSLLDVSLRTVLRAIRQRISKIRSPEESRTAWIDSYCNQLETTYDVHDVRKLAEDSGLDVIYLQRQGREDLSLLPQSWLPEYHKLEQWSKWRLMELLTIERPSAMVLCGRKAV